MTDHNTVLISVLALVWDDVTMNEVERYSNASDVSRIDRSVSLRLVAGVPF
jgi:hypothetical protein